MREHRTARVEIRSTNDTPGLFEAVVLTYGVVDDYDTIFDAGVFADSLDARLPRITWGHDWADVIGRYVDYRDTTETLTLIGQLDLAMIGDVPAVPRAHQAYAQLQSGTIDQFSVGFRRGATYEDDDGRTHFQRATLDEAALVLAGAVPGTSLVGVRTIPILGREIPESTVISLAKQVAAGDLTKEEAFIAIDLATSGAEVGGSGSESLPEAEPLPPDTTADALEALANLGIG